MVVLRSRLGAVLVALAMVASAAVAGALIGEVTGADAVVESGEKPVMIDMDPTRFLDTRPAPFGPIGVATAAPIGPKGVLDLTIGGVKGVPADATAAVLNITTINATAESFLTLYPKGSTRPNASTMNPDVGLTQFNGATIPLGAGGAISIYNHLGSVDVIIDVTGYFVDHNHNDKYYMMEESDAKYVEGPVGGELFAGFSAYGSGFSDVRFTSKFGPIVGGRQGAPGEFFFFLKEKQDFARMHIQITPVFNLAICTWRVALPEVVTKTLQTVCVDPAGAPYGGPITVTMHRADESLVTSAEASAIWGQQG